MKCTTYTDTEFIKCVKVWKQPLISSVQCLPKLHHPHLTPGTVNSDNSDEAGDPMEGGVLIGGGGGHEGIDSNVYISCHHSFRWANIIL